MPRSKHPPEWTEERITGILATRHPDREWVFVPQVRNTGGYGGQIRTLDAAAISCWSSRGFRVVVYEIKCSRADWLAELDKPEKREWAEACGTMAWFVR